MKWRLINMAIARIAATACLLGTVSARADDLTVARTAMQDEMFGIAEPHLRQVLLRETPGTATHADAYLLLLRCLDAQGRYADLLAEVRAAEPWLATSAAPAGFRYWQARALQAQGETAAALQVIEGVPSEAADPHRPELKRLESRVLLAAGQTNAALRAFGEYETQFPAGIQAAENLLDWGDTAFRMKAFAEATNVLHRLLQRAAPADVAARGAMIQARARSALGDHAAAAAAMKALGSSETVPPDLRAEALCVAADVLSAAEQPVEALAATRQAVALAATPVVKRRMAFALGYRLLGAEDPGEGVTHLRALIREAPTDPASAAAQLAIADRLLALGQPEAALPEYQMFLETYDLPALVARAQQGRGWAFFRLGRFDEAAIAFHRAFDAFVDPDARLAALMKVGDAQHAGAHYAAAVATYRQRVELAPDSPQAARARYQEGESLLASGQVDAALRAFGQVVSNYVGSAEAPRSLLRLGEIHGGAGRPGDAMQAYGRVLSVSTNVVDQAEALLGRGLVQYRALRFRAAISDFRRALALKTRDRLEEQAAYLEAMSLYWLRRDAEALDACTRFLVRYPVSPWRTDVLFWIGKHHYNRGEFEQAEKAFLNLADGSPESGAVDDALLWAGRAAFRRKAYAETVDILTRLVTTCPESVWVPEARFTQADALSEQARFDEAILRLDEIIERYPDHDLVSRAWGRKGDFNFMLGADQPGRYAEAISAYRMATTIPGAEPDLILQAESKIGRCLEKQGRVADALEQYYTAVIARYLAERDRGVWHSESSQTWFAKAAFDAAELLVAGEQWRQAVRILERVVQTDVPGSDEARTRIDAIVAERPWLR